MPNKNNRSKGSQSLHVFKGLREVFLIPGPRSGVTSTPYTFTTAVDGSAGFGQILCPLGLTSTTLGASSYTQGTLGNVTGPPLRGLYNRSLDFQWYRVTRAKFVFISSLGSTVTGVLSLSAYSDPSDVTNGSPTIYSASVNNRVFDLSTASHKEVSVPVPVDSAWKKCTTILTQPGNVFPFTGANAGSLAVVNTVADLSFGAVSAYIQSAPASTLIGGFYLDYDVEFKNPIDNGVNL